MRVTCCGFIYSFTAGRLRYSLQAQSTSCLLLYELLFSWPAAKRGGLHRPGGRSNGRSPAELLLLRTENLRWDPTSNHSLAIGMESWVLLRIAFYLVNCHEPFGPIRHISFSEACAGTALVLLHYPGFQPASFH